MKASDILKPYRKAAPVLGYRANAWITLLTLLEAGPEGLTKAELMHHYSVFGDGATTALNRWQRKGLLTIQERKCRGGNGGRPASVYIATDQLRDFLSDGMEGITPADILSRYNEVAPALKKRASVWITFLLLCESGSEGMSKAALLNYYACNNRKRASALHLWEHAQLVTPQRYAARGAGGGRTRTVYTPTPKLHSFLRVGMEQAA
jgi:hypothetical protein